MNSLVRQHQVVVKLWNKDSIINRNFGGMVRLCGCLGDKRPVRGVIAFHVVFLCDFTKIAYLGESVAQTPGCTIPTSLIVCTILDELMYRSPDIQREDEAFLPDVYHPGRADKTALFQPANPPCSRNHTSTNHTR